MPLNLGDLLIQAVLPAVKSVETAKLYDVLEKLYAHNVNDYKATVQSLYPGLKRLLDFAKQSKTPIDDAVIMAAMDAIEQSCEEHSVELPS